MGRVSIWDIYIYTHICIYIYNNDNNNIFSNNNKKNNNNNTNNNNNNIYIYIRLCEWGSSTGKLWIWEYEWIMNMIEGSLEVKLPTIWTDEKQRWKGSERRERLEERSVEEKESEERRCRCAKKVGKSRKHCVFPMFCGSGGSKSRLAKAAGAEPAGQMRDEKLHAVVARSAFSKSKGTKQTRCGPLLAVEMSKKCTPLWREAHFQVKMHKTHHCRTTFGSCNVVKVHAVVARSRFRSQNVQNTPASDHFY